MINDFKDGLEWNERCNDSGNMAGFFTNLQCWFVCLLVSTRTSRQERTAVWPACPATPSARSSLPAWVTDLCEYSTGGWVQMNGKTHTLSIYHPCDLWPHLFLIKENVKVNNNYPAPFTVSPFFKYIQEHTQVFLWALTPTDSYIIHFSNLYLLHIMCCKSPFGGSTSFNGPWWHHIAPVG